MLYGLRIPIPTPIGEPSGITAAQPTSSRRRASTGSSVVYGSTDEAVVDELLGGGHELDRIGQQRAVVADHLELDPVGRERLPGQVRGADRVAGGEAAGGVGQDLDAGVGPARRGSSRARLADPSRRRATVQSSASASRQARGEQLVVGEAAGARGSAGSEARGRRSLSGSTRPLVLIRLRSRRRPRSRRRRQGRSTDQRDRGDDLAVERRPRRRARPPATSSSSTHAGDSSARLRARAARR